jgi:hypothetical protein
VPRREVLSNFVEHLSDAKTRPEREMGFEPDKSSEKVACQPRTEPLRRETSPPVAVSQGKRRRSRRARATRPPVAAPGERAVGTPPPPRRLDSFRIQNLRRRSLPARPSRLSPQADSIGLEKTAGFFRLSRSGLVPAFSEASAARRVFRADRHRLPAGYEGNCSGQNRSSGTAWIKDTVRDRHAQGGTCRKTPVVSICLV